MSREQGSEQPPTQQVHHNGDAAHALCAAIAQIGVALHESQHPVAELGRLCANLAATLAALRSLPTGQSANDPDFSASSRGLLEQLQSDVFKGIQQLQFYDRMVQHLEHIQRYLISVANELGSTKTEAQPQEVWDELHARLRKRLISDEQRGLLDLFLSPDTPVRVSAQAPRSDYSLPGSSEMF
jgi:hypothetical protein